MKALLKAVIYALYLEAGFAFVTLVTCGACSSGSPTGLPALVIGTIWSFHAIGFVLAKKFADGNTAFWLIMLGGGFLQWTFILRVAMHMRARKPAERAPSNE